jgi:hypothetical protein
MFLHVLVPREIDPETKQMLESAEAEEQQLRIAQDTVQMELKKFESYAQQAQETIRDLVNEYNKIALSGNFVGYIQSAIRMLEYRRVELQSMPDTDWELKTIAESIRTLEQTRGLLEK